jgi:hypothetical protein
MESRDLVFYNVERRPDLAGRPRSRSDRARISDVSATEDGRTPEGRESMGMGNVMRELGM